MSWAIEELLNIVWCLAAVGTEVEANNLTDSALVGAKGLQCPDFSWARVVSSFRVFMFRNVVIV